MARAPFPRRQFQTPVEVEALEAIVLGSITRARRCFFGRSVPRFFLKRPDSKGYWQILPSVALTDLGALTAQMPEHLERATVYEFRT